MKMRSGRHRYYKVAECSSCFLILQVEFYEWTGTKWKYTWEFATAADIPYATIIESSDNEA